MSAQGLYSSQLIPQPVAVDQEWDDFIPPEQHCWEMTTVQKTAGVALMMLSALSGYLTLTAFFHFLLFLLLF